ncbi:acyl carrier protein [Actinomadura luteofluorescens]
MDPDSRLNEKDLIAMLPLDGAPAPSADSATTGDRSLADFGYDSIAMADLMSQIELRYKVKLPDPLLGELLHVSITRATDMINQHIAAPAR